LVISKVTAEYGVPVIVEIKVVLFIAANPFLCETKIGEFRVMNLLNDAENGELVIDHSPIHTTAVPADTKLA
jgi:hypothetical protein